MTQQLTLGASDPNALDAARERYATAHEVIVALSKLDPATCTRADIAPLIERAREALR